MQVKAFVVNEDTVVRRKSRAKVEAACEAAGVNIDSIRAAHPSEDVSKLKGLPKVQAEDGAGEGES